MDYLSLVRTESDAFLRACLDGSLDAPVPSCPDWTVGDLLGHLGTVQRFHGGHMARGVTDPPPGPRPEPPAEGLAAWVAEGTAALLATLSALSDDAPAWTFEKGNPTIAFWRRRMAHEAAIHRWDAQMARGAAGGFDPDFALDGIAEYLEVFLVNRRRREEPPPGTVTLVADEGRRFTIAHGDADAAVTISGPAATLYLAVWGRTPLARVTVEGDQALADAVVNR